MLKRKLIKLSVLNVILMTGIIHTSIAQQEMPPIPVETVKPHLEDIKDTLETTGILKSESSVFITTETPGRITQILFEEGTPVKKGDVLFKLDDTLLLAELKQAQARQEFAKAQFDRLETLLSSGTGNLSKRDEAAAELKAVTAQTAFIQAKIDQTSIQAPFSGVLGLSSVEVGDYIVPGQNLINLEAIDSLKVDFKVPETYLSVIKVNQGVYLTLDGFKDKTLQGILYAIDPQIDSLTHSVNLRARIKNTQHILKPGLFARVALILEERKDALLIPEQAVQFAQDHVYVYRVEEGVAHQATITTGVRRNAWVEVLQGLSPEDTIIISGQNKLYEGAKVLPK